MTNHKFKTPNGLVCQITPLIDRKANGIASACGRINCGIASTNRDLFVAITVKIEKKCYVHLIYYHPYSHFDSKMMQRKICRAFNRRFHKAVDVALYAVYNGDAYYYRDVKFALLCAAVKHAVKPVFASLLEAPPFRVE